MSNIKIVFAITSQNEIGYPEIFFYNDLDEDFGDAIILGLEETPGVGYVEKLDKSHFRVHGRTPWKVLKEELNKTFQKFMKLTPVYHVDTYNIT